MKIMLMAGHRLSSMKKSSDFFHLSALLVLILLIGLFFILLFFNKEKKENDIRVLSDHIISNFQAGLSYEMADLLSFSLALSEDGKLKNALIEDNEEMGYKILSNTTKRFKKYTHLKSLRLQVLTLDFSIFARSWDRGFEGMPLQWFREDLESISKNNEPKVGMETGRMLTFKATIPIRSGENILGYLEVIKLIDEFAIKLRKRGIELYALMNTRYLKQATLMREFPYIHDYVIANQNFNRELIETIKSIEWEVLRQKEYLYKSNILYLLEPMYNGENQKIGEYLLVLSKDALKRYEKGNQSVSFFTQFSDEDIKKVVASWQKPYDGYRSEYDKDFIASLPKLQLQERKSLEIKARAILDAYKKRELIDIILHNRHQEAKRGVIK